MDGYNGYNQIMIALEDQLKNLFHHRVWSIRIPGNALWIDVCTNHFPKRQDEDF